MEINIKQTALAIKEGDEQAFQKFYDAYFAKLYRFLLTILRDPDDAEDVTSVAFIYVWDNRGKLRQPEQLVSWLYQVGKHRAFDLLRRLVAQPRISLTELHDNLSVHAFDSERLFEKIYASQILTRLLREVSDEDRAMLYLRFAEELSFSEIGERLGIAAVTARVRTHRIIKYLKTSLLEGSADSVSFVTRPAPKTAPSYD